MYKIDKKKKFKYSIEQLLEYAMDWWELQPDYFTQCIILEQYMKHHQIKEGEVEW